MNQPVIEEVEVNPEPDQQENEQVIQQDLMADGNIQAFIDAVNHASQVVANAIAQTAQAAVPLQPLQVPQYHLSEHL